LSGKDAGRNDAVVSHNPGVYVLWNCNRKHAPHSTDDDWSTDDLTQFCQFRQSASLAAGHSFILFYERHDRTQANKQCK